MTCMQDTFARATIGYLVYKFMTYPHCCTCTDSPIMGTGSNKVNRQLASF